MNLSQLLNTLNIEADYISLREVKTKTVGISVRNEVLEGVTSSFDHGLMVEVMLEGQLAYAATNSFETSDVKKAALLARESALSAKRYGVYRFSENVRPKLVGEYNSPAQHGVDHFNPGELTDLLMSLSTSMKIHDHIISRSAYYSITETESRMVATNGSDINQKITRSSIGLSVTAASDKGTQKRTFGDDQSAQFGLERLDKKKLVENATRIANEALLLLEADDCPSETMDLLLAPDQMFLQIHESIGHPLELDRILGDERNYAGWSFVKPTDFGTLKYGSELMNVTFDPTVVG